MDQVFVTGMLRSGTSLVQTLLTNLPGTFVVYQPFHRLYVDVKRSFLVEHGFDAMLPLDDGTRPVAEREQFTQWLAMRVFSATEAETLVATSTGGKGGSMPDWIPEPTGAGTFFQIRSELHRSLARHFQRTNLAVTGSKEILCEEFIPSLLDAGVRCVLVLRDPRGVIASANNGRYQASVGDQYPIMMLLRLWRKTAAYWLRYRDHPLATVVRYEDVASDPRAATTRFAGFLGVDEFDPTPGAPLLDHAGQPWMGNSSYGDKPAVDRNSTESWRDVLPVSDQRFIAACARWEMQQVGYLPPGDINQKDIERYCENTSGVRESYLSRHRLDDRIREQEMQRYERLSNASSTQTIDSFGLHS